MSFGRLTINELINLFSPFAKRMSRTRRAMRNIRKDRKPACVFLSCEERSPFAELCFLYGKSAHISTKNKADCAKGYPYRWTAGCETFCAAGCPAELAAMLSAKRAVSQKGKQHGPLHKPSRWQLSPRRRNRTGSNSP